MKLITRLKIWTLISHAFIVIGLGHGILTIGVLELLVFFKFFRSSFSFYQYVAFLSFAGQISIVSSILLKHPIAYRWAYISGICLLWASIIVYAYGIRNDNYAHIAILSCLPFVYCTIKTFLSKYIERLWQSVDAKI